MRVAACGVRLPDFDERMRKRAAVFVDDAAGDDDAFAERLAGVLLREVECLYVHEFVAENWAGDFGERVRQMHERLRWGALLGRDVRQVEIVGLRAGMIAAVGANWLCLAHRPK